MGLSTRELPLLLLGAVTAIACNRDASANQGVDKAGADITNAAQPLSQDGKGQFDEAAFNLSIGAKNVVTKGHAGEVAVVLSAKAPFHVNHEYPHRFKVTTLRGLTTPSNVISRDPAKVTPARLELSVPVKLEQAGPYRIEGEMSFSVCTDEKCLMEKRVLILDLNPS